MHSRKIGREEMGFKNKLTKQNILIQNVLPVNIGF